MNNHEKCVNVLHEMMENGFKLVDETPDEFVTRYEQVPDFDTLAFLNNMLENVKKWNIK